MKVGDRLFVPDGGRRIVEGTIIKDPAYGLLVNWGTPERPQVNANTHLGFVNDRDSAERENARIKEMIIAQSRERAAARERARHAPQYCQKCGRRINKKLDIYVSADELRHGDAPEFANRPGWYHIACAEAPRD